MPPVWNRKEAGPSEQAGKWNVMRLCCRSLLQLVSSHHVYIWKWCPCLSTSLALVGAWHLWDWSHITSFCQLCFVLTLCDEGSRSHTCKSQNVGLPLQLSWDGGKLNGLACFLKPLPEAWSRKGRWMSAQHRLLWGVLGQRSYTATRSTSKALSSSVVPRVSCQLLPEQQARNSSKKCRAKGIFLCCSQKQILCAVLYDWNSAIKALF